MHSQAIGTDTASAIRAASGAGREPVGQDAAGTTPPRPPSWPQSTAGRVTASWQALQRFLGRRALARATFAVPRTARFVWSMFSMGEVADTVPAPRFSMGLAAQVAMDEALLAMALTPNKFPRRADYQRVSCELSEARRLFARRGWAGHPERYHRTPPPLRREEVRVERGWSMGIGYQRLSYLSGFSPRSSEPGRERWQSFGPNQVAVANIVRHRDAEAPWLVCVHGFCMGYPFMDFRGLNTARLHRDLGVNIALPVLPLHGRRKVTLLSGEPFLSFDLMNAVHGITQAVWDIRRLITWIRAQGATSIGLYGVSLGGYVVSLLAGLEPSIDAVVAGIPVTDLPALFHQHSPLHVRARSIEHHILGGTAEDVCTAVSPLYVRPEPARDQRFIFAGYGDRLALPEQAQRLWEHWERPEISWYAGNHVGYLWSRQVGEFLVDSLRGAGLAGAPAGSSLN